MEKIDDSINPSLFGDHSTLHSDSSSIYQSFLEEQEEHKFYENLLEPTVQDDFSFLQMLRQTGDPGLQWGEPNVHALFPSRNDKTPSWSEYYVSEAQAIELESCITESNEDRSPVASGKESRSMHMENETKYIDDYSLRFLSWNQKEGDLEQQKLPCDQEKRKRKRTKTLKNIDEVENQRMTHIAVERNRRKLMNENLSVLRSLMTDSYVLKGDQASIISGAINFVKELEQLHQSLEARKQKLQSGKKTTSSQLDQLPVIFFNEFFKSPQFRTYSNQLLYKYSSDIIHGAFSGEFNSVGADVEVTLVETHVNLKVLSNGKSGKLLKALVSLQKLHFSVLHLTVTSANPSILYNFNLKIEEECKLRTANDIAAAVHTLFTHM